MGKGKDFRNRVLKAAAASATPAAVTIAVISGSALHARASVDGIVINEVFGGGGTTNTTVSYDQDFIELLNTTAAPISLTGDIIQYASATGSFPVTTAASSNFVLRSGVLAAGGYYLITGATSTTGTLITTEDQSTSLSLAASAGKVRLLLSDGSTIDDLIGYGSTAASSTGTAGYEGTAPAPAPSITTSDNRTAGVDTDHNNLDFTIAAPTPQTGGFTAAAPEPTSLGLLGAASAMVIGRRRRK